MVGVNGYYWRTCSSRASKARVHFTDARAPNIASHWKKHTLMLSVTSNLEVAADGRTPQSSDVDPYLPPAVPAPGRQD